MTWSPAVTVVVVPSLFVVVQPALLMVSTISPTVATLFLSASVFAAALPFSTFDVPVSTLTVKSLPPVVWFASDVTVAAPSPFT